MVVTDYLARLLARQRETTPALVRRHPSLFEETPATLWPAPTAPAPRGLGTALVEIEAEVSEVPESRQGRGSAPAGPRQPHVAPIEPPGQAGAPDVPPRARVSARRLHMRGVDTVVEMAERRAAAGSPQPARQARTVVEHPAAPAATRVPAASRADRPAVTPTVVKGVRAAAVNVAKIPEAPAAAIARLARRDHDAGSPIRPSQSWVPDTPSVAALVPAPAAIHVTIGRIEVRAAPADPSPPRATPVPRGPKLGLEEYLRTRGAKPR